MSTVLAVDLGGTKTATAFVGASGGITELQKTPAASTFVETVEQIAARAHAVSAVGIIVPGIFDTRTGMAWCPNLWGGDEVPLLESLRAKIQSPVVIDSDRSGYVLGESWLGAAQGLSDVVFIALGTGIGIGILSEGRVVRGAHGIAGAAGWWALSPDWRPEYARAGCWESEAAGPAVARHANAGTAEAAVARARENDPIAREAVARAARFTGMGVANLISLLNPEMVVLGGGLMQAGDLFLEIIRAEALRWAQPVAAPRCRIELTELGENAGLLGAARLAFLQHT